MAIDPFKERVVSLTEAARRLPRRRGGKSVHPSCLFRWAKRGLRGTLLETTQVGGTKCTSLEALDRFFRRLAQDQTPEIPSGRTVRQRERAITAAERQLDHEGL